MPYSREKKKMYDQERWRSKHPRWECPIQKEPKPKPLVLTKFPILKDDRRGIVSIFQEAGSGDYYYGKSSHSPEDKKIEDAVTADFAFEIVGKYNNKKQGSVKDSMFELESGK